MYVVLPGYVDGPAWLTLSAGMDQDAGGWFCLLVTGGLRTEAGWLTPTLSCATGLDPGAEDMLDPLRNSLIRSLLVRLWPLL